MSEPVKILVYDNNPSNPGLIKDELSKLNLNFDISTSQDVNSFLDRLDEYNPHIILFNYKLSTFESLTALAILKKRSPALPLIYIFNAEADVRTIKSKISKNLNTEELAIVAAELSAIIRGGEEQAEIKSLLFSGSEPVKDKSGAPVSQVVLLESLLNVTPDLIMLIDSSGVIRNAYGDSPESIFPSPETYKDRGVNDVFPESFLQIFRTGVNEVLSSKKIVTSSYIESIESEKIYIEVRFIPYNESQLVAVFRDITDQKSIELKLSFYSQVINNLDHAVITTDADFKIYTWNNAARQMYGLSEEEAIGRSLEEVIPITSDSKNFPQIKELLFEKGILHQDIILETPLGINHTISSTMIALRNIKNKVIGMIQIDRDITDLKINENKIRRENEKMKMIIEKVPESIFVLQNSRIIQYNSSFPRMLGYQPDELINQDLISLVSSEDQERVKNSLRLISNEDEVSLPDPGIKLLHKNGINKIFASLTLKSADDITGATAIGITKDITESVGVQSILDDASHGNSLGDSGTEEGKEHDFRTYMNGIMGFADILKEHFKDVEDKDFHSFADEIYSSGRDLLNLLDLYPELIDSGNKKIEVNLSPVPATDLILKIIDNLQQKASEKNLKLNLINRTKLEVLADVKKLSSSLSGILENSIKYSYDSAITIETGFDNQKDMAFIKIKDTGLNLDEKFLPGIFKPIRKELEASSPVLYNSGRSFTTAKKLLELMNGKFVIAALPERGVLITLFLAIDESSRNKLSQPAATFYAVSPEVVFLSELQPTFLIVEDDPGSSKMLELTLKSMSRLAFADTGEKAMEVIEKHAASGEAFDLVLMDIGLPDPWDGVSLRKEIVRRYPQYEKIPFLAQTAYATLKDRDKIIKSGFSGYVTKPIDRRYLIKSITSTIKKNLGLQPD